MEPFTVAMGSMEQQPAIIAHTSESVNIYDCEEYIDLNYSGSVGFDDIGKIVFLTRAEAEAALRRGGDTNERESQRQTVQSRLKLCDCFH